MGYGGLPGNCIFASSPGSYRIAPLRSGTSAGTYTTKHFNQTVSYSLKQKINPSSAVENGLLQIIIGIPNQLLKNYTSYVSGLYHKK
jgi:hypothetical protein